jgi:hypothetical protein
MRPPISANGLAPTRRTRPGESLGLWWFVLINGHAGHVATGQDHDSSLRLGEDHHLQQRPTQVRHTPEDQRGVWQRCARKVAGLLADTLEPYADDMRDVPGHHHCADAGGLWAEARGQPRVDAGSQTFSTTGSTRNDVATGADALVLATERNASRVLVDLRNVCRWHRRVSLTIASATGV